MSVDWTDEADAAAFLRADGIETDLSDGALHAKARAEVQAIAARGLGPASGIVSYVDGLGQRFIAITPAAASVSEVLEDGIELAEVLEDGIELAADANGYRLREGGTTLERLLSGYPHRWHGRVVITYDAAPADERYDRVVSDLVKLALQYSGLDARRDGDYSEESIGARGGGQKSYQDERDALIAELAPAWSFS